MAISYDASSEQSRTPAAESVQPVIAARNSVSPALVFARIPQLDGLRGIAILLVLGFHYFNNSETTSFSQFFSRIGIPFRMGWSGVDLFFVLSGFLIGGILLDARGAHDYFQTFYLRRLFRIVPVYYLWVSLCVLVTLSGGGWLAHYLPNDPAALKRLPFNYLFLQNFYSMPHGSLAWYWLTVAWSLGVEEQFYLIAPPLIRFLSLEKLKSILLATIVLAPLLRTALFLSWSAGGHVMYSWMPFRADSLAIGVLAALLWREGKIQEWYVRHRTISYLILVTLLAPLLLLLKWPFGPFAFGMGFVGYTWLALLSAALLLLCLLEFDGLWSHFLRWRFLREMGRLSYCIYLIHLLILGLTQAILMRAYPKPSPLLAATAILLAFLQTFVLAELSWRYLEHPLLRRGHAYKYSFVPVLCSDSPACPTGLP